MRHHMDLMVEIFGEELGCRMFRKVGPWYSKRFGPAVEFNRMVVQLSTRAGFEEILAHYIQWRRQFLDETGELKEVYRPGPMTVNFANGPASAERTEIPVPQGPVEVW